ncbi:MAG: EF-hand domain-containing protein [archaeon]|nr:EF-hand domain-containing protein [archaeon]
MEGQRLGENELYKYFDKYDADGDGLISAPELRNLMTAVGCPINDAQLQDLINYSDITLEGLISGESFIKIYNMHSAEPDTDEELEEAFRIFDKDNTGYLTVDSLLRVFRKIDESLREEEILQMIKENDLDHDGKLSYNEFCAMVKNK